MRELVTREIAPSGFCDGYYLNPVGSNAIMGWVNIFGGDPRPDVANAYFYFNQPGSYTSGGQGVPGYPVCQQVKGSWIHARATLGVSMYTYANDWASLVRGWEFIGGEWYHFDDNGYLNQIGGYGQ